MGCFTSSSLSNVTGTHTYTNAMALERCAKTCAGSAAIAATEHGCQCLSSTHGAPRAAKSALCARPPAGPY